MNIQKLIELVEDLSRPKSEREQALRQIRELEQNEDRVYYRAYNQYGTSLELRESSR